MGEYTTSVCNQANYVNSALHPSGSLNRVPALIGWGKGWNVTSAGWQVILCDPIWHVSSRSGVVLVAQTTIRFLTVNVILYTNVTRRWMAVWRVSRVTVSTVSERAKQHLSLSLMDDGLGTAFRTQSVAGRFQRSLKNHLPVFLLSFFISRLETAFV